jgi:hypothetical protein
MMNFLTHSVVKNQAIFFLAFLYHVFLSIINENILATVSDGTVCICSSQLKAAGRNSHVGQCR